MDYYLIGGEACREPHKCDQEGVIANETGNRVVVTDQDVLNGTNGVHTELDQSGNLQITTAQGTFQGQFFDPNTLIIRVNPSYDEQKLMALQDAGARAGRGVKAAAVITAPEYLAVFASVAAIEGAGLLGEATIHGAQRLADPSRLTPFRTLMTRLLATSKYTQADGAQVFVREVGGNYDVVIRNPITGKIITNLR